MERKSFRRHSFLLSKSCSRPTYQNNEDTDWKIMSQSSAAVTVFLSLQKSTNAMLNWEERQKIMEKAAITQALFYPRLLYYKYAAATLMLEYALQKA